MSTSSNCCHPFQFPEAYASSTRLLISVLSLLAVGGCGLRSHTIGELMRQGQSLTLECLHAERIRSDGDESRCEDWTYVQSRFLPTKLQTKKP
jgi:hypothetical protein